MQTSLVATIVCRDQPGIVERIARVVSAHQGSWEESRMARLAGRFAGILRATVPSENVSALEQALAALRGEGIEVTVQLGEGEAGPPPQVVRLSTVGTDRPGIVHGIFRCLAEQGVNVQELETELVTAPMSGEPLFRTEAKVSLPPDITVDALRERLEAIGADLQVDVTLVEA